MTGVEAISNGIPAFKKPETRNAAITLTWMALIVEMVRSEWGHWQKHLAQEEETHLVVIESPYRSLVHPLLAYIDMVQTQHPEETLTVILHEFVVVHWWEYFLHNQTAFLLKAALLSRLDVVVTDIPLYLRSRS